MFHEGKLDRCLLDLEKVEAEAARQDVPLNDDYTVIVIDLLASASPAILLDDDVA